MFVNVTFNELNCHQKTLTRRFGPYYCGIDHATVPLSDNEWKRIFEWAEVSHCRLIELTPEKWDRLIKKLGVCVSLLTIIV